MFPQLGGFACGERNKKSEKELLYRDINVTLIYFFEKPFSDERIRFVFSLKVLDSLKDTHHHLETLYHA